MKNKNRQIKEYWFCNTYHALELMHTWHQETPKSKSIKYIITSIQRRGSLRFNDYQSEQSCVELLPYDFWISLLLDILLNQNYKIYIPHKSRHLFESRRSAILFIFLSHICPISNTYYYDEGLSLFHIIAGSQDYPSKALLTSRPMLCSEFQYMFYTSLGNINQSYLLKVKAAQSISKNNIRITVRYQKEGLLKPPKLHLIASRFLDYQQAFAFSAKLVRSTLEMIFYSHPNPMKNPTNIPAYMKKKSINRAIEDYLVHTVAPGDIVILGFTSLLPYLLWMSANLCLDLNLVILMHKPVLTISDANASLLESFLSCATSMNCNYTLVQAHNELSSYVIFGPLAPKLSKILAALEDG